jgi:hypothetical protein
MGSSHDYHLASEPDLKPSTSRQVWYYFIFLGLALYLTIYGLDVFYRFALRDEKDAKIGAVNKHEALDSKAMAEAYLSGKRGLFADKPHVAIDVAIAKFLQDVRKPSVAVPRALP